MRFWLHFCDESIQQANSAEPDQKAHIGAAWLTLSAPNLKMSTGTTLR